ncbi:MAG: hypothetical protein MZV63_42170 [Marinilabiliales bacterium]|nr:hypothetical protein [Marinilabiliales bacterium]
MRRRYNEIKTDIKGAFHRNPMNSLIIIISLAIGIALNNLIILLVTRELNTDSFQQNRDRIYLLKCDNPYEIGTQISKCKKGVLNTLKKISLRLRISAASG